MPVSPGETAASAAVEARCPTFSWTGVPGARGYELAVYRFAGADAEPTLVARASVLGDARGWTPSATDCLERGQRYAWSVAAIAGRGEELAWSPPFLFDVEAAPSLDELEQAIATIERYRTHGGGDRPARLDSAREDALTEDSTGSILARRPRSGDAQAGGLGDALPGALTAPTSGIIRIASEANTPTLGVPSLRVSANIALNAATSLFKDDKVFLWDDTTGNSALGREALSLVSGNASNNTAVGRRALQNTTGGATTKLGSYNTAIGDGALRENTTGYSNTASGYAALFSNTTGYANTASGYQALYSNLIGTRNTASGQWALFANRFGHANTAIGYRAMTANKYSNNTAVGHRAMAANTNGFNNTAIGSSAMAANIVGSHNTAIGMYALSDNSTGFRNTAVGDSAGVNATTGHDNVFLGSGAKGVAGEGHTIRIGGATPSPPTDPPADGEQNRTFIAGIRGITTANSAVAVLVDSAGQLGTVSSSRALKQDIQDLGPLAERLLDLRPVAFRFKQHVANDPDSPPEFGLIAEEVAEVFPELVVFDEKGKPETIKYHLLSSLLLGELQRQNDEAQQQHGELQRQRAEARRQQEVVLEQGAEIERLSARLEAVENR